VQSVSELNKRRFRLFVEGIWNDGRVELIDELVAADYLGRFSWMGNGVVGPAAMRRLLLAGKLVDSHTAVLRSVSELTG
jgi:hypothetical protein